MAEGEEPLVQESTVPVVSAADPSRSSTRLAHTLLPGVQLGSRLPALPTPSRAPDPDPDPDPDPVLALRGTLADFTGWPGCPPLWKPWVDKLRPRHESLWRDLGILDAILATTYRVRRDEGALLQLAAFWSADTNTFFFPWGEATVTLLDVAALAGLPLVGDPVRAPVVSDDLAKEVGALKAVRSVLHKSKNKKASYRAWANHFLERTPDDKDAYVCGGGELVEHGAFLSLWLSSFVLPSPSFDVVHPRTFPIAARLARGQSVALAPAALARIYNDLSALKRRLGLRDKKEPPFMVSAPMHILQIWVWERFPQLRPETANTPAPDVRGGVPRVARWHDVCTVLDKRYVHRVLMSPERFEWAPYRSTSFDLQPKTSGCWVRGHDIAGNRELLSYARCLHPCELVGMSCIEMYRPHRVARQLGFDQDVPGNVVRVNSTWEKAWDTYNTEAKNLSFIVPNHEPDVTVKYAQWWEPYSSACDTAIANAARMKQLRGLGSPIKRKMEGLPDANSCKKLHVDTAIRVSQPTPDAAEDPQDEIPLVERLNSIINMMRRQRIMECLEKCADQELIAKGGTNVRPISASVGDIKAVLHKDFEQALADGFPSSVSIVDESSSGSDSKMAPDKYLQRTKEEGLVIVNEEKNSRPECGDALFHTVVQGAVTSGSIETTKSATDVDMVRSTEDTLVTGDCEVETDLNGRALRQEPDVFTRSTTIQTNVGHSKGPTEQMQKCTVIREIDNRGKGHKENIGRLDCDEIRNEDVLISNQDLESLVENPAEANGKRSGNSEKPSSSKLVDGTMVGGEVCTKTLYYLSRFDRAKDAWEKACMPRRAVGTMKMIKMASAIRQSEIAGLKKDIERLKQELLDLEAA